MIHIYRASKPDDKAHRKDDLSSHELIYSCNDYNFFGRKSRASCLEVNIRSRFQHCPLLKYILKISFYLVTNVGQRKTSEFPCGTEPQTFGIHAPPSAFAIRKYFSRISLEKSRSSPLHPKLFTFFHDQFLDFLNGIR